MWSLAFGIAALLIAGLAMRGYALVKTDPLAKLSPQDRALITTSAKRKRRQTGPLDSLAAAIAPDVANLLGPAYRRFASDRIVRSGNADYADFRQFMQQKCKLLLIGVVPAVLISVLVQPLLGIGFLVALFFIADISLASKASERQEQIEDALPDFLDVLAVTVSAGLSFRAALERVIERVEGPLSDELRLTLRQMDVGQSRSEAFAALRSRTTSESLESFVTALLQSEELGSPLSDALDQIALDMRRVTAQRARQKASKANPKISAVVTLVMVPGTMVLIMVSMYFVAGIDFGEILSNLQG